MSIPRWFVTTPERTQAVVKEITEGSEPKASYYALLVTSAMIACFGLVTNSTAVIIGAMLVSPLMTPIFGIAAGMLRGDAALFGRALRAEFGGVALAIFASWLFGMLPFVSTGEATPEMIARTQPTLLDLMVAVFAGFAGAYALLDERVSPALPGVAIAVAIVPPLSTCGLCLSGGAFDGALGAFILFFANFIAILLVALVMFAIAGMAPEARWNSLNDLTRRFGLAVIGFMVIAGVLTHSLVRIYGERQRENAIERVLNSELGRQSVALDDVRHKSQRGTVYVMATVRSPNVIAPERVSQIQAKLREALDKPTELVVRTMLAQDVAAVGSNISVSDTNLNGVFFRTGLSQREARKRLARQVLLESLNVEQGYRLNNLEFGESASGSVVYAAIDTIRPIQKEDILAVEQEMQKRLGEPKLALVVQFSRSTVVEKNGRLLIEWTNYGNETGATSEEVVKLKQMLVTEAQKLTDVIPLGVHFHIHDGIWHALVETVGPHPAKPPEVVQLQQAVAAASDLPIEVSVWHRTDVVVTSGGYAAFDDFTRETLKRRIESLPEIFGEVASQ